MIKKNTLIYVIALVLIFNILACSKKEKINESKEVVSTTKAQVETAEVKSIKNNEEEDLPIALVRTIKKENLQDYVQVSGKLEGITEVDIKSETSGKIIDLYKNLGDWVEKDEKIGKVDNEVIEIQLEQAKAGLLSAKSSYTVAENNYKAVSQLYEEKIASESEYQNAMANFNTAKANLQSAKATLRSAEKNYDNSLLKSSVSGYIADINLKIGEFLSNGNIICKIVNTKKLKINAGLSESEILKIRKNQEVDVYSAIFDKTYKAQIVGIGKSPNSSLLYPIEIQFDNDGNLYSGMVVSINIFSKTYRNIIKVSMNEIIKEYDDYYAYILNDDATVKKVKVTIDKFIKQDAIISSGLKINDNIVTEGLDLLNDGEKVKAKFLK